MDIGSTIRADVGGRMRSVGKPMTRTYQSCYFCDRRSVRDFGYGTRYKHACMTRMQSIEYTPTTIAG